MVVCKCLTIEATTESNSEADGFSRKDGLSSKPETTKFRVKGNSASNRASWLAVKKTDRVKKENDEDKDKERCRVCSDEVY